MVVMALLLIAAARGGPDAAQAASCPRQPHTLSVPGTATTRFTMLIRVNKPVNALTYASHDAAAGGLADRIHPQDVFVVNTRFRGSTPADWSQISAILRSAFPCNRIVALNGLGQDPARPGYAAALLHSPGIWAVLTD